MAKKPILKAVKKAVKKKTAKLSDSDILNAFTQLSSALSDLSAQVKELRDGPEPEEVVEDLTPVRRADGKMITKAQAQKPAIAKVAAKTTVSDIKARYELWAYDEYNQGSIVSSGPRLDKIVESAKRYVTELNVDNALAAGEKDKSWEAFYPQIFVDGEETNDVLYAGNKRDGKHYVYVRGDNKWELRKPDSSVQFRFFLGSTSNGRIKDQWYLKDQRGKSEVSNIADISLERKTVLFVKII